MLVSEKYKSPNFYVSLLVNYGILRKTSYLCRKFRHSLYIAGAPDKPSGVGRADANPKLLLNDT